MRQPYDGVVLAAPVTVPYVRYSIRSAHWWLATAFSSLLERSRLKKEQIDGLTVSSFTLAPDTAIGFTQHIGLSPRWLDHVPLGGARGVVAPRRAARALPRRRHQPRRFLPPDARELQPVRARRGLSLRRRWPERELRLPYRALHATLRREARGLRQALRCAALECPAQCPRFIQEGIKLGGVPPGATDRRAAASLRLRHALRRRRGFFGNK